MADLYGNISISDEEDTSKQEVTKPSKKTKPPQKNRWKKLHLPLFALIACLLIYICLGIFGVPYYICKQLPATFQQKTGYTLSIESAKFNPFAFTLSLHNVVIKDGKREEFEDLLSVTDISADFDLLAFLRHNMVAETLNVSGATLTIFHFDDSSYNISPFLQKKSSVDPGSIDFAELPFLYSFNNIKIKESAVLFQDLVTGSKHVVEDMELSLPSFSNFSHPADISTTPHFSAIVNGSPVELMSNSSRKRMEGESIAKTSLSFRLKALNLPLYINSLPLHLPFDIKKGQVDGEISISFFKEAQSQQICFEYGLQVSNIHLVTHDHGMQVSSPLVSLEGGLNLTQHKLELRKLIVRDPNLIIKENFSSKTIGAFKIKQSESSHPTLQPVTTVVNLLLADNGQITVEKAKNKNIHLSDIQLAIRNYVYPSSDKTGTIPPNNNSFRLAGGSKSDLSTFIWQGKFVDGLPVGNIEINNGDLQELIPFLQDRKEWKAKGTFNIKGIFSLDVFSKSRIEPKLTKATLHITKPQLYKNNEKWLTGSNCLIAPFSYDKGRLDLTSIQLDNSTLFLRDLLPFDLVQKLTLHESLTVDNLQFNGALQIRSKKDKTPSLHLKQVKVNIKNLTHKKTQKDNFHFSGRVEDSGTFTVKGTLQQPKVEGQLHVDFQNFPTSGFLQFFGMPKIQVLRPTLLNGKGTYSLKKNLFLGSIELGEGTLKSHGSSGSILFKKALFPEISFNTLTNSFSGKSWSFQKMHLADDEFALDSSACTLSELRLTQKEVNIGELSFINSKLFLNSFFPKSLKDLFQKNGHKLQVKKISYIGDAAIKIDENSTTQLENITINLKNLGDQTAKNNLTGTAKTKGKGELKLEGLFNVRPLQSQLNFQFSGIHLEKFPEILFLSPNNPLQGIGHGNLTYQYPQKSFNGSLHMKKGWLGDINAPLLQWDKLDALDFSYTIQTPPHLKIAKLDIDKPVFSYSHDDNLTPQDSFNQTIQQIFSKKEGSIFVDLAHEIGEIQLTGGTLHYKDVRQASPLEIEFHDFSGSLKNIKVPDTETVFSLDTQYNGGGAQVKGALDFSTFPTTANYAIRLHNFPLSPWQKQIQSVFPLSVEKGRFNLTYNVSEQDNIGNFTFKSLQSSQSPSDLHSALALLQDTSYEFPISIKASKESSLFKQTMSHFQKMMVKFNVSPYLLLEEPFKTLGAETSVNFSPGEQMLLDQTQKTLLRYRDLLTVRPNLKLHLVAKVNGETDREILHKKKSVEESKRIQNENRKLLEQWKKRQEVSSTPQDQSKDAIIEKDIPQDQLESFVPMLPDPVEVTKEDLVKLGEGRIKRLIHFLHVQHSIAKDRLQPQEIDFDNNSPPRIELILAP